MPLDLSTPTAVAAHHTIAHCDRLPLGAQYVSVPRPEASRFVCPHPCGGACLLDRPALFAPAPLRRHTCHLELLATRTLLRDAALQTAPLLACDLVPAPARPACGLLHLN